jgi:hypothetical protein
MVIKIIKIIYRYSGIESICNKARVTEEQQPKKLLPTLPLWLIGIYVATFGVASQRYENKVDIIENKANTIYQQLASPDPVTKGMAFRLIPLIQKMKCPYKPNIMNPITIYLSFLKTSNYEGVVDLMKETVENWKGSLKNIRLRETNLQGFDLSSADLWGADLWGVDLEEANLRGAILTEALLGEANLVKANLKIAHLVRANLVRANLEEANLEEANLLGAYLIGANFKGANLEDVNLLGAEKLTIEQLSKVKTLYDAKLDPELMKQVKEKYPHLLEKPKEEESKTDE